MRTTLLPAILLLALVGTACRSTNVNWYSSPEEATTAIIEKIDAGEPEEASRIFNSFARSSIQRDRVYAQLFGAAEQRYAEMRPDDAAGVLEFVCAKYPAAVNAREALVYAHFIARTKSDSADPERTRAMSAAIDDYRSMAERPSVWVDLAAVQLSIDEDNLTAARADFESFLGRWDGNPPEVMAEVEELSRYLDSH